MPDESCLMPDDNDGSRGIDNLVSLGFKIAVTLIIDRFIIVKKIDLTEINILGFGKE